jgi:hypothetical protein
MIDKLVDRFRQLSELSPERQREVAVAINAVASGEVTLCEHPTAVEETTFPPGFWDKSDDLQMSVVWNFSPKKKKPKITDELAASMEAACVASEERQAAVSLLLGAIIDQEYADIQPSPNLRACLRHIPMPLVQPKSWIRVAQQGVGHDTAHPGRSLA